MKFIENGTEVIITDSPYLSPELSNGAKGVVVGWNAGYYQIGIELADWNAYWNFEEREFEVFQ